MMGSNWRKDKPDEFHEEKFAWWPVRSTFSKKRIWLKNYWEGNIYFDAMGRPPIKDKSWKLIYTENEYLLMLLRGCQVSTSSRV